MKLYNAYNKVTGLWFNKAEASFTCALRNLTPALQSQELAVVMATFDNVAYVETPRALKSVATLKRGDIVTLQEPAKTLSATFRPGEQLRFLGGYNGTLVRLSRVSDCAKLVCHPSAIGYGIEEPGCALSLYGMPRRTTEARSFDAPHSDDSGPSREIVLATVLAGPNSRTLTMHLTPDEERQYNEGMARLAELG